MAGPTVNSHFSRIFNSSENPEKKRIIRWHEDLAHLGQHLRYSPTLPRSIY